MGLGAPLYIPRHEAKLCNCTNTFDMLQNVIGMAKHGDSMACAPDELTIDALPDEILRDLVFPKLPFRTRAGKVQLVCSRTASKIPRGQHLCCRGLREAGAVQLVSRRWRDITAGPSACWHSVTLDGDFDLPAAVLSQIRFLASRAPAMRECHLTSWDGPAADAMFMALAGLLVAPARCEVITADDDCDVSANVLHALPLLPNLRRLECEAMYGAVPARDLDRLIGGLKHLSHLHLRFRPCACEKIEGGFPRGLLSCPAANHLTHLCLDNAGPDAFPKLPPRIADLQQLRRLSLADCGVASLPASLTRLSALSYLDISQSPAAEDEAIDVQLPKGLLWRLPSLRWLGLPAPSWIPQLARATQVTFLKITNVAQRKTGRRYLRAFAGLAAAGRLDLSSDLDLADVDDDAADDLPVVQWASPDEDFSE